MTCNWIKYFDNSQSICGWPEISWSQTQLSNMIGVSIFINQIEHDFHFGLGDYHYEEDWEVTVGQNDYQLIGKRIIYTSLDKLKSIVVELKNGTISR